MTPTIRIDDEVYALLQAEAKPFVDTPNSVLRRKLGLSDDGQTTAAPAPAAETQGKLAVLVQAELLSPAERLVWHRRQSGQTHTAMVMASGQLVTEDKVRHNSPSGAARHLAGYEINGWKAWRQERTGKTLDELWTMYENSK